MIWFVFGCVADSAEIALSDSQNYLFESILTADSEPVPAGEDTLVDWSALEEDLLGVPIDPVSEINQLSIIRFPRLSQTEVLDGINNDSLKQSDLSGYVEYEPSSGELSAYFSDFSIQGTYVEPAEEIQTDMGTFVIIANTGNTLTRMLQFFEPQPNAAETTVALTPNSASIDYTIDIQAGEAVVPEKAERYLLSWDTLTTNGAGNPLALNQIDTLMVGGFSQSVEQIEGDFLGIEQLADELYIANVSGVLSYDLSQLTREDGGAFEGFSEDYLWLIALRCSLCVNPAPPFLTLVQP